MTYGVDLLKKVVAFVHDGGSQAEARRKRLVGLMSACGVCGTGGLEKTCGPGSGGLPVSGSWTWTWTGYEHMFANTPMPPCRNTRRFVEWIAAWSARP